MKIFNYLTVAVATAGGFIISLLGGFDIMLKSIIILVVIDYISGVIGAIYEKKLSSEIGLKGIAKKVSIFLVIAVSHTLQGVIVSTIPLREITIMFFIANEGISILENVSLYLPIPERVKELLLQLRKVNK